MFQLNDLKNKKLVVGAVMMAGIVVLCVILILTLRGPAPTVNIPPEPAVSIEKERQVFELLKNSDGPSVNEQVTPVQEKKVFNLFKSRTIPKQN
jgi:hypothetical protein